MRYKLKNTIYESLDVTNDYICFNTSNKKEKILVKNDCIISPWYDYNFVIKLNELEKRSDDKYKRIFIKTLISRKFLVFKLPYNNLKLSEIMYCTRNYMFILHSHGYYIGLGPSSCEISGISDLYP